MLNEIVVNINVGVDTANPSIMIPLVAVTGFLDGIHPCP
jgi:hypothetical protein